MSHMKTCDYSSSRLIVIGQQFNSSKINRNYRTSKSLPKNSNKIANAYALLRKSYCNPIPRSRQNGLPQVHHQQLWFSHILDRITQAFTPRPRFLNTAVRHVINAKRRYVPGHQRSHFEFFVSAK
jgi:hypothetical protein